MKLSQDYAQGSNVIHSFTDNKVRINDRIYHNSLLLAGELLVGDWGVKHIDELSQQHWLDILEHKPEVILIGTGETLIFPHPSSYAPAIELGIGVEFMDTGAACRTYNVLLSEDRAVIAGLIL